VSRLFAVALLFSPLFLPVSSPAEEPETWESLEEAGEIIGRVEIVIRDVFDLSDPAEDHFVGRAANAIHAESRKITILQELLFRAGERVDARVVGETERRLRARSYIREARIAAVRAADGTLVARVVVDDAWSLRAATKFRYEGGDLEWGLEVEEVNLFGRGKSLRLGYEDTKERSTARISYRDPRLFGSWWRFGVGYEDLSDGQRKFLTLNRPFPSLDAPWAFGIRGSRENSTVRFYDLGEEVLTYPAEFDRGRMELWKNVLRRGRWVLRLGPAYRLEKAEYGEPLVEARAGFPPPRADDRDLRGLFLQAQYLQDIHIRAANLASIGSTEDINLGWDIRAAAGAYRRELGGSCDALAGEIGAGKSWRAGEGRILRLSGRAGGRHESGDWRDSAYGASLLAFDQRLTGQTLAFRAAYDAVVRPAPESFLSLGASDGVRGYVNDFLPGDRRWIVSLEDRFVTDWILWGMAQVGFVIFADAGALRRLETGAWSRTYADVGGGLRVGNLKSAFGRVAVATFAFPLVKGEGVNGFEIFIGNEIPF
jgi:hypothetical protein